MHYASVAPIMHQATWTAQESPVQEAGITIVNYYSQRCASAADYEFNMISRKVTFDQTAGVC